MPPLTGLLPGRSENDKRRIKQILQASAPFLQRQLLRFSFTFFFPEEAWCLRHSPWCETRRQTSGLGREGGQWPLSLPSFQEPIDQLPNVPMYFPPGVNSWTIFLSKLLPNLLGLVRRMANFRVSGGLRGHRSGISSITQALWLGGGGGHYPLQRDLTMTRACHLKVQSGSLIYYLLSIFHPKLLLCNSNHQTRFTLWSLKG